MNTLQKVIVGVLFLVVIGFGVKIINFNSITFFSQLASVFSGSTGLGIVQGSKEDNLGAPFTDPGATVSVGSEIFGPANNIYTATVSAGSVTAQSTVPTGYDVYYSLCINCIDHPASNFVKGSQVIINLLANSYADLHWKYVKAPHDITLPGSSQLQALFRGTSFTEIYQSFPNVYAPEVLYENGIYKMWYGGGGADIRDRIHYAESTDGITWTKKGAIIEAPSPNYNANDPTVVKVNGKYYMYMSISESDLLDAIYLSTSTDGLSWSTPSKILSKGPYSWNSRYVSRPTVIYDNGMFKMWYDTTSGSDYFAPTVDINIGYATSVDGINWQKYENPVFSGYAAIDVKKINSTYVMLIQGAWLGTLVSTSTEGTKWSSPITLIAPEAGDPTKVLGHLTPFLYIDSATSKPKYIYMGAGIPNGSNGYMPNAMYRYVLKEGELEKFIITNSPPTTPKTQNSTKFKVGDIIKTTSRINIRSSASTSGTRLGVQASGSKGTIISGGQFSGGYYWWNVNYDKAPDGWSAENYLLKISGTSAPAPAPIQ